MPQKPGPLVKVSELSLRKSGDGELEHNPGAQVRRWARGDATLQEIKGYSDEETYHIAQHGYSLFLNGKVQDAQTVFEGLVAIDPRNEYHYRALGVVYHRRGDADGAIRQFTHAIKVAPRSVAAHVNRAEVHISRRDYRLALEDLERAVRATRDLQDPQGRKARALRTLLLRRSRR